MRKALWHETVIVEGDEATVADRYAYFPVDNVDHHYLRPSTIARLCPWKAPPG